MTARIPWSRRRFDFDFPADVYPELIERLRGMPSRAAALVARGAPARLTRRPPDGWSIQEHVGHLADIDEAWFPRRLDDYDAGVAELRPADMTNRRTEAANHNARAIDDVLDTLRRNRAAVLHRLAALEPEAYRRAARHPRLGTSMRLVDMLAFHAEHDDHHLARIAELMGFDQEPGARDRVTG